MRKILKTRKIFNGSLLKLSLERQRFPNNYIADLEVVRHPGAVLVVPVLDSDKAILIRQYRPVIDAYIWELPAGTLKKNEPPLECAKRELIEEIGYSASLWKKIGFIYPAPGYTTEKINIYVARKLKKVKQAPEIDEIIKARIFLKKDIAKLLKSGKIIDAKTICALKLSNII